MDQEEHDEDDSSYALREEESEQLCQLVVEPLFTRMAEASGFFIVFEPHPTEPKVAVLLGFNQQVGVMLIMGRDGSGPFESLNPDQEFETLDAALDYAMERLRPN